MCVRQYRDIGGENATFFCTSSILHKQISNGETGKVFLRPYFIIENAIHLTHTRETHCTRHLDWSHVEELSHRALRRIAIDMSRNNAAHTHELSKPTRTSTNKRAKRHGQKKYLHTYMQSQRQVRVGRFICVKFDMYSLFACTYAQTRRYIKTTLGTTFVFSFSLPFTWFALSIFPWHSIPHLENSVIVSIVFSPLFAAIISRKSTEGKKSLGA